MNYIESQQFADNMVIVSFEIPLDRKTITAWNLLMMMLRSRTEKWDTRDGLIKACAHAFGTRMNVWKMLYSNTMALRFGISWIPESRVGKEGYLKDVLELTDQFFNRPCLRQQDLDEARYMLANSIALNRQNPMTLAMEQLDELAPERSALAVSISGYAEDLEKITLADIHQLYESLKSITPSVMAIGRLEPEMKEFFESFDSRTPQPDLVLLETEEFKEKETEKDIEQSAMVEVYSTGVSLGSRLFYAEHVLNEMLGGGSGSLLFNTVREEHSLCYSISSELMWSLGTIIVAVSASKKNLKKISELIKVQIEKIARGDFDERVFRNAKDDLIDAQTAKLDSASAILETNYQGMIDESLKNKAEHIASVTREQVMEAASRLKLCMRSSVVERSEQDEK